MIEQRILLDRNENQYGPAPACFEVLQQVGLRELGFYPRDYERKVKSKLSERLANDLQLPEERILLSYGSEDMLKQAIHCYLKPGEKILVPNLSWWYYKSVAAEVDGIAVEYPLLEGTEKFHYDTERILELMEKERPRILLIASPNNPTGNSLPYEHLHAILTESADTLIVLDEAYWGFTDNSRNESVQHVKTFDNLLILRTFSKFYALAGARIGYACAGKSLSRLIKFSTRYLGYSLLSEKLALAALEDQRYYEKMRTKIIGEREKYIRELGAQADWKPFQSDANFLLVRIPHSTGKELKAWLLKKGIAVKLYDEENLQDSIRITVGTEEQNDLLLGGLKEFADKRLLVESPVAR
jgi:histidinol-phosphate aminotransferase